jgi:putative transposase
MARIARVVAPGLPHHITQRGNRRQETFFCAEDYQAYIDLMREWCGYWKVAVWAYCLMPNHVHLIAVPPTEEGLRRAIGEAYRRYTRRVNFREGTLGRAIRRGKPGPTRGRAA